MGLLPYQDGVIVFSIPNIWHLRDTNRAGKEFSVAEEEIDERIESKISLIPSGFETTVDERTFYDLLAFLLAERGK